MMNFDDEYYDDDAYERSLILKRILVKLHNRKYLSAVVVIAVTVVEDLADFEVQRGQLQYID